ncbi:hypothetical protein V7201_07590 [Bacillus sp. JJ1122]|uniref:hypothetical protein n=1 Tax=Bacillus sp. JJ1122 TaxID=3122951 RepID=UPI002FFEC140
MVEKATKVTLRAKLKEAKSKNKINRTGSSINPIGTQKSGDREKQVTHEADWRQKSGDREKQVTHEPDWRPKKRGQRKTGQKSCQRKAGHQSYWFQNNTH